MKLFYSPNAVSAATAIALYEAGIPFEPVRVNFAEAEQTKPAYLEVNPKGRVPALVTTQGTLTETPALLEYVASLAPEKNLMPTEPFAAAEVRSIISYLASTMHINHAHRVRGARWADRQESFADMQAKVPETMAASCAYLEPQIKGPFLFGDAVTIADCHLYVVCTWLEGDGVDVAEFPKLAAFMKAMRARPAVEAAYAAGIMS